MGPLELEALKAAWGDKPCDHPDLTPDRGPWGKTGDYYCPQCGEIGWGKEWAKKGRDQA